MAQTILTADLIRRVRSVAQNMDASVKIDPYIKEAEFIDVLPAIGVDVYRWFVETDFTTGGPWVFKNSSGMSIAIDTNIYNTLMYGGYFADGCGCDSHSMGLVAACGYFAYRRALRQSNVNLTSFGAVGKRSEFSNPISDLNMNIASKDAEQMGKEAIRQVVEHLLSLEMIVCKSKPYTRRRIIAVG